MTANAMLASLMDPSASDVAAFLGALFFLVAGYNQLMKAVDRAVQKKREVKLENDPNDPLRVQMAVEFVRKEECVQRHSESTRGITKVEAELAELRQQRITDAKDAGASREKMYKKMEEFRKELSEHVEKVRTELSDKIDDMPERVIATLKNTGAI